MGVARLLAKGWLLFCLYAGAVALERAMAQNVPLIEALRQTGVCTLLFGAMGILFVSGFGLSSGPVRPLFMFHVNPLRFVPGFNELVFIAFVLMALSVQIVFVPGYDRGIVADALRGAVAFAVFGQRALEDSLETCAIGGGRLLVSACSWILALIFLGSSLSRIRLAAGIVRLERKLKPEPLGGQPLAFAQGVLAVLGIQLLYVGSLYSMLPCRLLSGVAGDVLIGIGPLMLAYLIVAALTNLLALGPEA
jgi:hypothetical protein